MRGLIHLYCGDGKGKTTAALGLALRAAGRERKVLIARFLKNDNSGEVKSLEKLPAVTLLPCTREFGFSWNMTPEQKKQAALYYSGLFEAASRQAAQGAYDLLVLDEIVAACNQNFVSETDLIWFLKEKPEKLEVVLTGRNPSEALCDCADYITEMVMRRHPYEKGIGAREGIEY